MRHGRETESTGGMLGLAVSKDFSFRCLDFETESLFPFLKENFSLFFLLDVIAGSASMGWKTATVARSRGSEVYS